MPSTHADKDEICPNCLNFNLLIVNTCYVSLRASSVCRDYFFSVLILKFQFNKNFPSFGTSQYGNTIIVIYTAFGFSAVTAAKLSGFQKLPEAEGIKVISSFDNPHHHSSVATRTYLFICAPLFSPLYAKLCSSKQPFHFQREISENQNFFIVALQCLSIRITQVMKKGEKCIH